MTGPSPPDLASRRGFVQWLTERSVVTWLVGTSFGAFIMAVLYPAGSYLVPPAVSESAANSVTLPFGVDELPPNSARIFKFGSRPGLIVHTSAGELRAFSASCTHLGCTVQYRKDIDRIWCACHNGHFDMNGHNVEGPPPTPLERYAVYVRGEDIIVTREA